MKRTISLLICFLLVFTIGQRCYADINFSVDDYSTDELAQIYSMISEKIWECVVVPAGVYTVGKDLPAGTYQILSNRDVPGNKILDFSHVAIFANKEDFLKDHKNLFDEGSLALDVCNTNGIGMGCELSDGNILYVKMGRIGIQKVNKNIFEPFW